MKKLALFLSTIALIAFLSSCNQDNLSDLESLDQVANSQVVDFQEDQAEAAQEVVLEKPDTTENGLESRTGWVKIHEDIRELHHGNWYSAYLEKGHLDPHCKYILKVTPIYGNADAYIVGKNHHGQYRNIRWSNNHHGADETYAYYNDLQHDEYRMYFNVYAYNACKFKIEIYKDCDYNNNQTELYFKNVEHGHYYHAGIDLYAKVYAYDHYGVDYVKLFVNGHYVRQEDHAPYEWGKPHAQNDHPLNNMQPGTYELKAVMKNNYGQEYVKKITIHINGHYNDYPTVHFKNIQAGGHYGAYRDLYVKVDAYDSNGIDWVELYVNDHLVRREDYSPYEWGKPHSYNDHALNYMHPGTYWLKVKAKDHHGYITVKKIQIHVN